MEESVFTKILKHEIPGEIVYEDAIAAVILTIEPITPGHCLVIPKNQVDSLWDLESEMYHHLLDIAKRMARKIETVYDYKRVGMIVEGFGVPHAHIHVFGFAQPLEPTIAEYTKAKHIANAEELSQEAAKLRA